MPVTPTYPGVYIEEVPSGVRSIAGVATSIGAFVGPFNRGLVNEAVRIQSPSDFEREYGGLDRNSEASYAVEQFFLNGGGEAWIVRVQQSNPDAVAGVDVSAPARANLLATAGVAGTDVLGATVGRQLRGRSAENHGTWGNNLRLEVADDNTSAETNFTLTIKEVAINGDITTVVQQETYRNLTMEPNTANNAIEVVNGSSRLVQLTTSVAVPAATDRPHVTGTLSGDLDPANDFAGDLPTVAEMDTLTSVEVQDAGGATILNPVNISFAGADPITSAAGWAATFQQRLRETAQDPAVPLEMRPYLSGATVTLLGDGSAATPWRFLVTAGQGARPFDPDLRLVFAEGAPNGYHLDAGVDGNVVEAPQQLPMTGGADGTIVDGAGNFVMAASDFAGNPLTRTGLYSLDDIDLFNILSIPDAPRLGADGSFALYSEALTYVTQRRAMMIIDIEEDLVRVDQMESWLANNAGLRSANSAIYFPRIEAPNPLMQNRPKSLPSSGAVAGLWARIDGARGVWKAGAGTDARLRGVTDLPTVLTDEQNGVLNPLGVNCLRSFPIFGPVVWGARTLEGADALASEWKYLPIRRLTLFLEESLYRGTQWVVFEPNDAPLWAQVRLNVGAFMQGLFLQGAFQGSMPDDAYRVKCDGDNNPQASIDAGILNIDVAFAPLKPAEFVILRIQQIARVAET